jgi:hypothetical protein
VSAVRYGRSWEVQRGRRREEEDEDEEREEGGVLAG